MTASSTTGGADNGAAVTVRVIGIGKRTAAAIVDALIVLFVTFIVAVAVSLLTVVVASFNPEDNLPVSQFMMLLGVLVAIVYYVGYWSKSGATIGKSVLGMQIVDNHGHIPSGGRAVTRFLGYVVSAVAFSLGFFWIGIDKKHQGWHDKIAGTHVVDVDDFYTPGQEIDFEPAPASNRWIWVILWLVLFLAVPGVLLGSLFIFGPALDKFVAEIMCNIFSIPTGEIGACPIGFGN